MEPDTERSDQVVARVVAWHNRHPLATRITADQVHSVGVVSLPFAVKGAQVQALAVAAVAPPEADAVAPSETAATDVPAPVDDNAGADSARTILDRALDAAPAPPTGSDAEAEDAANVVTPAAAEGEPVPTPVNRVQWQVSGLPARPPRWHLRAWWRRLRGGDPYRALFTEDFIAPLRPARVARWAAQHGQAPWPLEPGAAQRMVMLDTTRRLAGDTSPELDLHLITAAIGIGDARLRLLLAPGDRGAVLGQRHLSRQRLAMSAPLVVGLMVGLGAVVQARWPAANATTAHPMLAAAAPASATIAASAASAARPPVRAAAAASLPAPVMAGASATPVIDPGESKRPHETAAAPRDPVEVILPPNAEPRRGRVALPPLVPPLADAQRHELRQDGRALRQEPLHQAKAWALVTATLSNKRQSERVAAQLHAVALLQPVPMRAELLPSGTGWRAVFWPFASERDAEKVRLALADKGLLTEVLEF